MTSCKAVLSLAVLLLASAPLALAQGTYTQIDYPGAIYSEVWGVDAIGDVSGFYEDATSEWHGYILSGGIYTQIDYPDATGTFLYGLNDLGQVVGDTAFPSQGFLYDISTHAFTQLTCDSSGVIPIGINNAGVIAGFTNTSQPEGLALVGSDCRTIPLVKMLNTYVYGVSASNELVGYLRASDGIDVANFSYIRGAYAKISFPNALRVVVQAISPTGDLLAGYYSPSPGTTAGFLYNGNNLTTLQFPGSSYTSVAGVSSTGEAVGVFISASGAHGFTWTPPADTAKK